MPYTTDDIERVCGEHLARYAANKKRGGENMVVGYTFEVACAVYNVVLAIDRECSRDRRGEGIYFDRSPGGFVDDLAETDAGLTTLSQMKSGPVSWNGGKHPIDEDFRHQAVLDYGLGRNPRYELVVSSQNLAIGLTRGQPEDLRHVAVRYVLFHMSPGPEFLVQNPDLEEALCRCLGPVGSKHRMLITFQWLVGAYLTASNPVHVAYLVENSRYADVPFCLACRCRKSSLKTWSDCSWPSRIQVSPCRTRA